MVRQDYFFKQPSLQEKIEQHDPCQPLPHARLRRSLGGGARGRGGGIIGIQGRGRERRWA